MFNRINNFIFNKIGGNIFDLKRLYLTKSNVSVGKRHFELKLEELKNCVNSIPLAERFDLNTLQNNEIFKQQFNLNKITPEADSIAICFQNIDKNNQKQNKDEKTSEINEFYVFSDGVVTFWNIDRHKQENLIKNLLKHQLCPLNEKMSRSEEEIMKIEFTKNNSNASDDTIYLNNDVNINCNLTDGMYISYHNLERFAFSHALAASVKMGIWERELDKLNDELEQCIDQLKEGKLIWKASKARQTIGKIASIRHSVNSTELLNKDIYWDLLDIERVYESLAKQLKLQSRQRELNKRIDYCEYFAKTIHEMLDQKHSHRLEWIIIILIFVEILINLPKIMGIFSKKS
ncbi:hypothetical protein ACQ4LE_002283, partial [Meloidogyne hapla]